MSKKVGDFLNGEEQFRPMSELGELMRTARISRPGAPYAASNAAQISEDVDAAIGGPIVFEEKDESTVDEPVVNLPNLAGEVKFPHIREFGNFFGT